MNNKIVLIGCGNVGMAYAYALLNQKTCVDKLVLIDINKDNTVGQAMDLNHCLSYSPSKIEVISGDYSDCKDAKIVVIAAGANQAVGETRMDLIDGIFLIASNPLDVMTYLTLKYSKLPPNRVIGSGTTLDTSRLRYLISTKVNINPENIDAYVIGEHGDSEFVPWSTVSIGLSKIHNFLTYEEQQKIEEEVKNSAYEIIKKKGVTCYGIGMCLVKITNAILEDQKIILPVSSYDKNNELCISTPAIVGSSGVKEKIFIPLTLDEEAKLTKSINIIKEAIKNIN